ncbi:hypothetical protein WICMUC_003300 [Wickerhamomyces mucosus]|uniref:Uncharacterized protein n=1 Tax=Wickerhamomyces mucosus TaxID=1378264 RepID=A0A9P8TCI9_9ASCO|nr:hypothetical protein WICMUC_003300 [Wickerhamomyces mucosus]
MADGASRFKILESSELGIRTSARKAKVHQDYTRIIIEGNMELNIDKNVTRFFLIRHGQTEYNKQGILQGHLDIPLNEEGFSQVKKVSIYLAPQLSLIDSILSSDLIRCRQTTQGILDQGYKGDLQYDSKFRERYMGEIQGKKIDEAIAYAESQGKSHYKQFGELPNEFNGRITELLEELKSIEDKNVILVTHGGFIRSVLKNLGHEDANFIVYNTSITTIEFNHDSLKYAIKSIGENKHLGDGVFKVHDYRIR